MDFLNLRNCVKVSSFNLLQSKNIDLQSLLRNFCVDLEKNANCLTECTLNTIYVNSNQFSEICKENFCKENSNENGNVNICTKNNDEFYNDQIQYIFDKNEVYQVLVDLKIYSFFGNDKPSHIQVFENKNPFQNLEDINATEYSCTILLSLFQYKNDLYIKISRHHIESDNMELSEYNQHLCTTSCAMIECSVLQYLKNKYEKTNFNWVYTIIPPPVSSLFNEIDNEVDNEIEHNFQNEFETFYEIASC